jgi:hypothetical protein
MADGANGDPCRVLLVRLDRSSSARAERWVHRPAGAEDRLPDVGAEVMPHNCSQQSAAAHSRWQRWRVAHADRDRSIVDALARGEPQKVIAWRVGIGQSRISKIAVARGLARRKDAGVRRCCTAT